MNRAASPPPCFFWHDYETFGRSPRWDRPAQFAGVRTDWDLNEVGDPVMLYCQPADDVLPDPESCLITGILPQQCQALGVPEPEFAARIERELAWPGTVGCGYNTLRFDDEFTRHLLWRNLRDPYAREWQNGCGRWDLLDVVRATYALRPEGIEWPTAEDGRTSFKLENLSRANGLAHEAAHDALSDVRATIALARLIKARQPRLFDFALRLRKKEAVWAEVGEVPRPLLHVSGMYGVERGCIALVWPLAMHPRNKNELIVWDLAADPRELLELKADEIRARLFVRQSELPEGVVRLPIKTLHANKSPFVVSSLQTLRPELAERWGLDLRQQLLHAAWLRDHGSALAGVWEDVYPVVAPGECDPEANLYGGFVGDGDRRLLRDVLGLAPQALAERIHEGRLNFSDARLEELVWRFRARHQPSTLTPLEQERWRGQRARRLHRGEAGGGGLADYLQRLDALQDQAHEREDERALHVLESLVDWVEAVVPPFEDCALGTN
ncbi:exodeoxyribonuclease I [Inhella gelatinilytica]|uniref:Exodeoxyribonuclease I n=1 Tax=Inhella gelatinilytica TaxID=2795030 RepID=A0A931J080_9BURK|nr:exodeoxyribonuclease I [Inhella gelatinilytica]MBH9553798.1 exodeoxyribonuclease I [Inhella gelatinilytica]